MRDWGLSQTFPDQCASCVRRRCDLTFGYGLGFQTAELLLIVASIRFGRTQLPQKSCAENFATGPFRQQEQLGTVVTGNMSHAGFYRTATHPGIPHDGFSHHLTDICTSATACLPAVAAQGGSHRTDTDRPQTLAARRKHPRIPLSILRVSSAGFISEKPKFSDATQHFV
jgi:hypothetical protein